jgi:hypothetical protein
MREYTSDELIIIGRHYANKADRERLLKEINANQSAMNGIGLEYSDEPERLLSLLEEQINLVRAFQQIEHDYLASLKAHRDVISGEVGDDE